MKFIGLDIDGTPWVARLDENQVLPLATVADFWGDANGWLDRAASATFDWDFIEITMPIGF